MSDAVVWYRSFYFRIGFTFVLFVVGLIVLQGIVSNAIRMRSPLRLRPPNVVVAIVAADVGTLLAQNPNADVDAFLKREYAESQPIYVVTRDGVVASNRTNPLADDMRRYVDTMLRGAAGEGLVEPRVPIPFVTAPIQMGGALHAMVVLPPGPPPGRPLREFDRIASIPGTALLVLLTILAAVIIFEPARVRLKLLQHASVRLGSGDLTARAPDAGGDEVAQVAASFNRMAEELAARDDALRTSDRLRRQMLADVSHELKTPLTAMRTYVETLRAEDIGLDRETRERYFATLERETVRLDRIVKDLLDLARLENSVNLDMRVFAIRRVFEHVVGRHQPEIERRRIDVDMEVSLAADQIVGDPDRIEQVIENLFANGLRHTPDNGTMTLAADADAHAVTVSVGDSGSGIPPEHIPHVFERFYKVDASRASESAGSGLGLSIARAIVERHGGTISVESRPRRTVFTITLPHALSTNL
jgi:signal transduction histidine kinase